MAENADVQWTSEYLLEVSDRLAIFMIALTGKPTRQEAIEHFAVECCMKLLQPQEVINGLETLIKEAPDMRPSAEAYPRLHSFLESVKED